MNLFRLIGDMLHLGSILVLIMKLMKTKNCIGVSCRMHEVYLIVFIARYLDVFIHVISLYNTAMKIMFISSTAYIIYLMRFAKPISQTYDKIVDSFPYEKILLLPCFALSLVSGSLRSVRLILWRYSIWLEAVAIIPQLRLLQRYKSVENLTSHYVAMLGLYRLFYIFNWVYRYYAQSYYNTVSIIAGVVQVALYLDFFYYYFQARINGTKMILPYANHI